MLTAVLEAFNLLIKYQASIFDPTEYIDLVLVLKRTLKNLAVDTKKAESGDGFALGLCQPRGWQPILTLLREGMLTGGVEIKEVNNLNF